MSERQEKYFNEKGYICKNKPFLMAHGGQQQQWLRLGLGHCRRAETASLRATVSLRWTQI